MDVIYFFPPMPYLDVSDVHLSLDLTIIMKVNMSFLTFYPLRTTSLAVDLLVPAASATSIQPECTAERVAEIRSTLLLLYGEHR